MLQGGRPTLQGQDAPKYGESHGSFPFAPQTQSPQPPQDQFEEGRLLASFVTTLFSQLKKKPGRSQAFQAGFPAQRMLQSLCRLQKHAPARTKAESRFEKHKGLQGTGKTATRSAGVTRQYVHPPMVRRQQNQPAIFVPTIPRPQHERGAMPKHCDASIGLNPTLPARELTPEATIAAAAENEAHETQGQTPTRKAAQGGVLGLPIDEGQGEAGGGL
jgi:hypothetical protein